MGLVFFGSGPVALESLKLLIKHQTIETIITKPSTKDQFESQFPNIPVLVASNKLELDKLITTYKFQSGIGVLIDFGIIISNRVINYFPKGIINSHFSRLPQWRGADPITFALLSGQKSTGVSLMLIDEGMDTGKILVQKSVKIPNDANSITLTDILIKLSDELLNIYLDKYIKNEIKPRNQSHPDRATYSKKLEKSDGRIDWTKPAIEIEREIRAYYSWPKSYTKIKNFDVIIKSADVVNFQGKSGDYKVDKKSLIIYCGQDALSITSLQPVGKKQMPVSAFLAGYKI